jgi:hypothetical protein
MIADYSAKAPVCATFSDIARLIAGRGDARTGRKGSVGARLLRMFFPDGQQSKPALTQANAKR